MDLSALPVIVPAAVAFGAAAAAVAVAAAARGRRRHDGARLGFAHGHNSAVCFVCDRARDLRDVLFETIPTPVYVKDADGQVIECNESFAALCGTTRAAILVDRHRFENPVERGDNPIHRGVDAQLIEGLARAKSYEIDIDLPNGDTRHYVVSKKAFRSEGRPSGIIAVLSDMTDRKALENELWLLANTDHLTEAVNRRQFMNVASAEHGRFVRFGRGYSLVMLDIDFFKRINDTYGHDSGDEALRRLVVVCRRVLRASDTVGRLGGEEFAVLMPETRLADAREVCERVRRAVAAEAVVCPDGRTLGMTVSIGVAEVAPDDDGVEAVMRRADQLLYAAKHGGRNRVCWEPDRAPGREA